MAYKGKFEELCNSIEVGSIFEASHYYGFFGFFEVVAKTAKTVTVRPIEDATVQVLDQWESLHMPKPGAFCRGLLWDAEHCEKGKRCKIKDTGSGRPEIMVTRDMSARLWDGTAALCDTYN